MAEYAISTNLISWIPAKENFFGWPQEDPEAEAIEGMAAGDYLIPKFAQNPDYRRHGSQTDYVKGICEVLDVDYETERDDYINKVNWGENAAPVVWRVKRRLPDRGDMPSSEPWTCVEIEAEELAYPLSTNEFLRLRAIPIELARQFKATAATGRHVQQVPQGTAEAIRTYGQQENRPEALRRLTLVKAESADEAVEHLQAADQGPQARDYAFLVGEAEIPGFYEAGASINLQPRGERISYPPSDLRHLLERAKERALPADRFKPGHAIRAADDLADFIASDDTVREVTEYPHFYDRFINLTSKVSQALELADRDIAPQPTTPDDVDDEEESEDVEQVELDQLHGLTTSAVQAQLHDIVLPPSVLAEAVTALRSGKHLLLSGPPGTGKSSVAAALCRAVVSEQFDVATATADWTTFDTIGGYIPRDRSALEFEPGIVLRSLQRGRWLVIDELNRADIDKAFGPLFTLLASSGEADGAGESVVLPFKKGDRNIRIVWAETREDAHPLRAHPSLAPDRNSERPGQGHTLPAQFRLLKALRRRGGAIARTRRLPRALQRLEQQARGRGPRPDGRGRDADRLRASRTRAGDPQRHRQLHRHGPDEDRDRLSRSALHRSSRCLPDRGTPLRRAAVRGRRARRKPMICCSACAASGPTRPRPPGEPSARPWTACVCRERSHRRRVQRGRVRRAPAGGGRAPAGFHSQGGKRATRSGRRCPRTAEPRGEGSRARDRYS